MLGRAHLGTALGTSVSSLTSLVSGWSEASAQQARRNAMVATTACAQRRAERDDVDDFLAAQRETRVAVLHGPADGVRRHRDARRA